VCGVFDAAFAKLLWPLVVNTVSITVIIRSQSVVGEALKTSDMITVMHLY